MRQLKLPETLKMAGMRYPARKEQDSRERRKLEDMGYRAVVIRYDKPLGEQIKAHSDVFGRGLSY